MSWLIALAHFNSGICSFFNLKAFIFIGLPFFCPIFRGRYLIFCFTRLSKIITGTLTDSNRVVVFPAQAGTLKRTLVAIVVRLLPRNVGTGCWLKKAFPAITIPKKGRHLHYRR